MDPTALALAFAAIVFIVTIARGQRSKRGKDGGASFASRSKQAQVPHGKFGISRHPTAGQWVQATTVIKVAGISHRRDDALSFAIAASEAERDGSCYGLKLRPDPGNLYDSNAIEVIGTVGGSGGSDWVIGFVDSETAKEMNEEIISAGPELAAELYSIYISQSGYIEVNYIVLAPPGNSQSARKRRRRRDGQSSQASDNAADN